MSNHTESRDFLAAGPPPYTVALAPERIDRPQRSPSPGLPRDGCNGIKHVQKAGTQEKTKSFPLKDFQSCSETWLATPQACIVHA